MNFYDERLQQYGWDDTNFYDRLMAADTMALNITRRNALGKTLITHVWHPHSDCRRTARLFVVPEPMRHQPVWSVTTPGRTSSAPSTGRSSDMPNNGDTGGEYITFAKYQGGDLPSVQATLGGEVGALLKTYCRNAQYAAGKCYNGCDWITGYNPEEELEEDDEVRWATEQLQRL